MLFNSLTGESDDDREELLSAASFASSASCMHSIRSFFDWMNVEVNFFPVISYVIGFISDSACTTSFWKKVETIFASVSAEDISHLEQQVMIKEKKNKEFHCWSHFWIKPFL